MAKGKPSGNPPMADITTSNIESNSPTTKGSISDKKVSGNPNNIIENAESNKQSPPPNMIPTALKLEEIDPLLSEQMGKLHQDCMHLALKYMDIASDFRRVGEMIGSYKQVIDQKLQALNQQQKQNNTNKKDQPK